MKSLALDLRVHQNPLVGALILYWMTEAHEEARPNGAGMLVPWGILGMGLLTPRNVRETLPQNKSTFGGFLTSEGARAWRGYVRDTILAWRDPFWHAVAAGKAAGILTIKEARLCTDDPPKKPAAKEFGGQIRRRSRAFGGTIGNEPNDQMVASAIGVEFIE